MKQLRLFIAELLVSLPLIIIVVVGVIFFCHELPHWQELEQSKVNAKYREIAESIKDGEVDSDKDVALNIKGKSLGRMGRGTWGAIESNEMMRVWYRPPKSESLMSVSVPVVPVRNIALIYGFAGVIVFFGFFFITNLGLRRWRKFIREREDFMAATAHDLTTPLAAMEMLIGRDDKEAKNLVRRMLAIVKNVREFLSVGRTRPTKECFDLVEAIKEAYSIFAADFRDLMDDEDVALKITGKSEVCADRTLTMQILWNLFSNELKYCAPYGKVELRVSEQENWVVVEFIDQGPGMDKKTMKRAFNRYYRAQSAKASGKGGFGIGLWTARKLARMMGAELRLRSNAPQGCIFTLSLKKK